MIGRTRQRQPVWLKMVRQAALCLIALLSLLPATAWADPTFPQLTGRVVDDAHLLSPEQTQAITTKLATLEQHTGRQLVVVTLPDLQGYEISDYGYQLGRHWGIGEKDKNTGALLIVAPNERRARIEVGYGLEPVLTDGLSSLIINQNMIPHFKDKDYPGGIEAGVNEIVRIIELPPDQQRALAQQVSRPRHNVHAGDVFKAILIVFAILFFIIISAVRAATRGGRRYRRGGGVSPIVVWAASEAIGAALRNNDRHGGWGGGGDSGGGFGGFGGGGDGGGFSGGGGSFGGGGASGGW